MGCLQNVLKMSIPSPNVTLVVMGEEYFVPPSSAEERQRGFNPAQHRDLWEPLQNTVV